MSIRTQIKIPLFNDIEAEFVTFHGLNDGKEHIAILFKGWDQKEAPLVRMHSECLTGDVFGSQRCDCNKQLHEAIYSFAGDGGILLYLRQEGRGIGLYNKLDAYKLQIEDGLDTFEANKAIHQDEDLRRYDIAAHMLKSLDVAKIKLLSNNPDKRAQLEAEGIEVQTLQNTGVFVNAHNADYLRVKKEKAGHYINDTHDAA